MEINEKTAVTVRIFDSTDRIIKENRGRKSAGVFIDEAVRYYVSHAIDNGDDLKQIRESLEQIRQTGRTNLGLLCEVLHQAGILDGNGDVSFKK